MPRFTGPRAVLAVLAATFWASATPAAHAAPPVNDTCAGAPIVGVGTHSGFSTAEATAEFPEDFSECGTTFESPDIWFVFPPEASGQYTISTCGSTFPTAIEIYRFECEGSSPKSCRGCSSRFQCASFDPLACAGAGGASVTADFEQAFWSDFSPYGVYYIRVFGVSPTDVGSVTLSISTAGGNPCGASTDPCNVPHAAPGCSSLSCCTSVCDVDPTCCSVAWDIHCAERASAVCSPYTYYCNPDAGGPPNDCATRATEIVESGAYDFSLASARPDGPATCGMRGNSLWWRFTATKSGQTIVDTCRYTDFNARTTVYDIGTDPANFDYDQLSGASVGCDFENLCGNLGDTVAFDAVAGRTYLVRVDNEIGTPAGSGRVAISMPWEYSCAPGGVANDCAASITGSGVVLTGTEVSETATLPFDTAGATQDGPFLAFGDSATTAQDVWYWFRARRDGIAVVSTCGTASAPVYLQVFGLGRSVDASDLEQLPSRAVSESFGSPAGCATASATVNGADYYLVRVSSMSRDSFPAGTVTITVPGCDVLPATRSDGEACGADVNGGCSTGTGFSAIALGDVVTGTLAITAPGAQQDRDWYLLSLAEGTRVTIECSADVPAVVVVRDQLLCSQASYATSDDGYCSTTTFCLPAGEHAVVVRALEPVMGSGCDAPEYRLRLEGVPEACASVGDDVAVLPPSRVSSTNPPEILPGVGVACVISGTQVSLATRFAKPFPELAGKTVGAIEVIDFGWQHVDGSTNTGVIELYDDVDGGAPVSEGVDLILVEARPIQLWTTTFETPTMHRWKLEVPRRLADFVGHPVLVLKTSNSDGGFASFAGTDAPESTPTYFAAAACLAVEFTPLVGEFEDFNWTVSMWGTFGAGCPADLDGNGSVDGADLGVLLGSWGAAASGPADLNGDGTVDGLDLGALLGAWGSCG